MKILITGANGFIGKNLVSHLTEENDVEIITYEKDDDFSKIEKVIDSIDFVFHLAGINRPTDVKEFYDGNTDLTKLLVDLLKNKNIPILMTSSIQAVKDNDYGKSKKLAEDYIKSNLKDKSFYIYRLHNVFGKWCRPNYNSVVATFCNNIALGNTICVNDPAAELQLIYIDDVVKEFINVMRGENPKLANNDYFSISPIYETTVGKLADIIYGFKNSMNSIYIPSTGDEFIKKLYSTYISYVPVEQLASLACKHEDARGSFTELVRTSSAGQVSISFSKPGVIRGNHYHHTKLERFIVVKGKARIGFTNIITGESYSFDVDDENMKIVTIPVGYTHNIENIGNDEMILVIWCNELFNDKNPDTFFKEVNIQNCIRVDNY